MLLELNYPLEWLLLGEVHSIDGSGTAKVAENPPLLAGVTVDGVVGTRFPSKYMVTIALGSKI